MRRQVVLDTMDSELRLRTSGVTIRILRPNDPPHIGRLRIGEAGIKWIPYRKWNPRGEKSWEDLIDFIVSTH